MPVPTRIGYTVVRHTHTPGAQTKTIAIPASTVAGDTMIVFAEFEGTLPSAAIGSPHWPTGWKPLVYENHGSRGFALWDAGLFVSGTNLTVTYTAPASGGVTFSLMTVRGAVSSDSWVVGKWWDRIGLGGGAMDTTTRALGIAAPANSLVLSFHGEASNATETSATSVSGATKWFESGAQSVVNIDIDRVYVSYLDATTAQTTSNVDVTWPNSATAGAAVQIAIASTTAPAPIIRGYKFLRHEVTSTPAPVDLSSVPIGAWMVLSVMQGSTGTSVTAPAGWTSLYSVTTIGTRKAALFAKIKESSDGTTANFTQGSAVNVIYALLWGTNGTSIDKWTMGAASTRSSSGEPSGARYTNKALSINTTYANTLAIAVSNESTLAYDAPYEIASFTSGWTEQLYFPQVALNNRIETIWMGTKLIASPSSTGNVDITYISPQDSNGWATQIGIPPNASIVGSSSPAVVFSEEVIGGLTGATLTFNKPVSLQDGDMLLVILRCQTGTAAYDWTATGAGWTRVGPAWPGASAGVRLNTTLVKLVTNAASEPSTYEFTKTTSSADRRLGHIIVLRSSGGVPQVDSYNSVYGGENPAGDVDKSVQPYTITTPSTEVFWAAAEFASPNDHAFTAAPVGFTQIKYTTTNTSTAVSRTVLYSGYREYTSGTSTIPAGPDWVGGPSGAAAGSVTFTTAVTAEPVGDGYVLHDGAGDEVLTYYTDNAGIRTPSNVLPVIRGFNSVAEMLATPGFTWAHRGGSDPWPEMSLHAYTQSVLRGYGVLEVSLARTSDGVWFGLHDQTTDRTSGGTYGNASSQTWAQIQAQQIVVGASGAPQPYMRWEEIVAAYGSTHIFVVDPKYALNTYRTEFLNMVYNSVGPTRAIIKYSGGGSNATAMSTTAISMGFETWGFFYGTDASAAQGGNGNLQTWGPYWTLIGMAHGASQAIWDEALALGKPVIGHIAANQTAYNTAMAKGAIGVQVSGVDVVEPVSWWNT